MSNFNYEHGYPCTNPNCSSNGKPHPGCRCGYRPGDEGYAHGGSVCSQWKPHEESCPHFADGGKIEENLEFHNNPHLSVDHAISHHGLIHALTKMGHSKSENEHKATEDFIDGARRGRKSVEHHTKNHFDKKHEHPEPHKDDIEALKKHLDRIRENPHELLEIGGNLNLPNHQAALAAKAAVAHEYLNGLRPQTHQSSPLDEPMPADKLTEQHYNRQLGVAQSPLSVLGHIRAGTVQPQDLQTLRAIYPQLEKSLITKTGESLINAKSNDQEIPYRHKMGLSHLLTQPMDTTLSPMAMQSIIRANAPAALPQPAGKGKKQGATAATQKTIEKTDRLYETPLERIEIDKRG